MRAAISATTVLESTSVKERLTVEATLGESATGWLLELRRGPAGASGSGDRRLRVAVDTICYLDVLTRRAIGRAQVVRREIPRWPTGPPPYSAAEMIIPLVSSMDRRRLYGFQEEGVEWLLNKPRAVLGDDMGLGKTAQALTAALELFREGRVRWGIVVAPRTLVPNWLEEAKTWAPELAVAPMLETGQQRELAWQRLVGRAHLIVTSYEQLRKPTESLLGTRIGLFIADEAHRLRKRDSLATQGVRRLRCERFWALTGTALERDAEDVAVLMSLLEPQRFSADDAAEHPTSLRARVRPYMLRRRKEDVLKELPQVVEQDEFLELTSAQRSAYEACIRHYARTGGAFLALFNNLRRICDMECSSGESSKLERIVDLLTDVACAGEKAVVFSYLLDPLFALSDRLGHEQHGIRRELLTGDMSLAERDTAVRRFMSESACTALLASTRIGSEGLTLTAANHVFFINRWWNPSANRQARDRVVRIGQERLVRVKSFTCKRTVEERVGVLLRRKSLSFDELVDKLSVDPGLREELLSTG